ncbi:MAG TPA: hypothetical protein VMY37_25310 [Thermoguttaceae bacterium]|nr:hypothetical protein [Thermoguttaceae bacterium]
MKNKALLAAALCLLLVAGCGTTGGSSRGRIGAGKWIPGPLRADSDDGSFAKTVERDPFPRAQAGRVRVAVRP